MIDPERRESLVSNPSLDLVLRGERLPVSAELLEKYNRPGPRYTSYPPAPEWTEKFGPETFAAALAETNTDATRPLSLYLHIPFCESLCLFCACNVVINRNQEVAAPYLAHLKQEIERMSRVVAPGRPVIQLHWGGGTPTYLTPAQIEDLFEFTRERLSLAAEAEIGIEVDPRVTTPEHIRTLRRLGFNRISMGVQDFNPLVQATIHRLQPFAETKALVELSRAEGFASLNLDLIYGLPHQTAENFAETVEKVISLQPDRVAMFSYAHVPWLKKQQGAFEKHLPEGVEKFRIFRAGIERFMAGGYEYIGMDHFARPADELALAQRQRTLQRNFQGYSTKAGADLYGMGVSAISALGAVYAQNHRELPQYYQAVAERGLATMRGFRLSDDDQVRRAVISRLLCHCVIRQDEIERDFGIRFDDYFADELERLRDFVADGLVRLDSEEIGVTLLGRIFIRNVAMVFDAYAARRTAEARPLFSKTL